MLMALYRLVFVLCLLPAAAIPTALRPGDAPIAPREFRAAWVATLDNIDWPSKPGLTTAEQHNEIRRILDVAVKLKLNAVILQVRSAADAIYPSKLEPWSRVLSGTQGRQTDTAWDPLRAWIEESHHRGIELHAWLNPCRAHVGTVAPAAGHISRTQPELVVQYDRFIWFDPGIPAAAEHILSVFRDVTERYDIDGIHVDDYFYPYPVQRTGRTLPFPDENSWSRYVDDGGRLSREDWRRQNVNTLVRRIHEQTHQLKPGIRFGISPFGISRPGVASGITGFDQFTGIYADPVLWLREGWCDYLSPQLYWPIAQKAQSFPVLLESWRRQNPLNIPIWPGLFTSRVGAREKSWSPDEILRQIELCRHQNSVPGQIHFSFQALLQDPQQITSKLTSGVYSSAALPPAVKQPPQPPPAAPQLRLNSPESRIDLVTTAAEKVAAPGNLRTIASWTFNGKLWTFSAQPAARPGISFTPETLRAVVSVVDRWGQESERTTLELHPPRPSR
ncbi:MAG: glycoside hydrolase family 10 protein [Planctomycetaceae bacterium]